MATFTISNSVRSKLNLIVRWLHFALRYFSISGDHILDTRLLVLTIQSMVCRLRMVPILTVCRSDSKSSQQDPTLRRSHVHLKFAPFLRTTPSTTLFSKYINVW